MIVLPTRNLPNHVTGELEGKLFLTIGIRLPDGHMPVSTFRGTNVGVGGRFCRTAPGEPVRRATLAEMRQRARASIAQMLRDHPTGTIVVSRSRH